MPEGDTIFRSRKHAAGGRISFWRPVCRPGL
jgi:hypothetical protein